MEAVDLNFREGYQARRLPYGGRPVEVSIVVPVCRRQDDIRDLYFQYSQELSQAGYSCEFIFVIDGAERDAMLCRKQLIDADPGIRVIMLNRPFGEATALAVGFEKARAPLVVTLPAYFQVEPQQIHQVIKALLSQDVDLVIARRYPRHESLVKRFRAWIFHRLVSMITGKTYHDLTCSLRAMKRKVAEEVTLYGDLHYFFPVLAYQRGFKIAEIPVKPSQRDTGGPAFQPASYLRRGLDLFNLLFLFKFTRKPLRFFGSAGLALFVSGVLITGYLGLYRLLDFGGISHRPLLILGVLLMVLGIQLFSIGLLGELVIFTHAGDVKDYQIREILQNDTLKEPQIDGGTHHVPGVA